MRSGTILRYTTNDAAPVFAPHAARPLRGFRSAETECDMQTFYSPHHMAHDPAVLPQPEGGSHNYYSEVAQRGTIIRAAVAEADLGPILEPQDFGLAPLLDVHSAEMITLLRTAWERMVHEEHGGTHHPRVVLPETFAVRHLAVEAPRSVWAHLGFYCYDTSSPLFEDTWRAVFWAAQTALSAAQAVHAGEQTAYALCRPPGHHAASALFGGFCYINNAAVAAHWLRTQGRRVAVLDIDYHHGNGTQEIFYARDDVLTVSMHADPHVDYPYFWGHAPETGSGPGEGHNLNLPLPRGTDEVRFLAALGAATARVRRWGPDVLVLSLGVDTYHDDPVGGFLLETESYARVGAQIARLGLPVVVVQEGGYALPALGHNVLSFLRGLVGA